MLEKQFELLKGNLNSKFKYELYFYNSKGKELMRFVYIDDDWKYIHKNNMESLFYIINDKKIYIKIDNIKRILKNNDILNFIDDDCILD